MGDLNFLGWLWAQREEGEQFYSVTQISGREVQSLRVALDQSQHCLRKGGSGEPWKPNQRLRSQVWLLLRISTKLTYKLSASSLMPVPTDHTSFSLKPASYLCTESCEKGTMLWINGSLHSTGKVHLQSFVFSRSWGGPARLPHSSHCCCMRFWCHWLLSAAWFLRIWLAHLHYLMPFPFYIMWTVVCWYRGCALIYAMHCSDSGNCLLLGDRIIFETLLFFCATCFLRQELLCSVLTTEFFQQNPNVRIFFWFEILRIWIFFPQCYGVLISVS